jgi:cyclophilin family peptidyl-prolyl cis-trans isomerase/HEAT repeat protein
VTRRGQAVLAIAMLVIVLAGGGVSAAPAPQKSVPAQAPVLTFEQKMAWILMLEDRRFLRDSRPFPTPPPQPPAPPSAKKPKKNAPVPPPPPTPDLVRLLSDAEGRVRRRAALAVGRVGLAEGIAPLAQVLQKDADAEVREMAAFALGLIGSKSASEPLRGALGDASPLVRGRAAEALGLIGDATAAPAIASMAGEYAKLPALAALAPGDETYPQAPEIEAYRLGIYALTRLKAWDALASCVLKPDGAPVTRWWPVAFALGRMEDPRAVPALTAIARAADGGIGRAFAARGLGAQKASLAVPVLRALAEKWKDDPRAGVQAIRALGQMAAADAAPTLLAIVSAKGVDPNIKLEAVTTIGVLKNPAHLTVMHDLLTDPWPAMRVAALRGAHAIDPESFLTVLSGLDADAHVGVRMALASILAKIDPEMAVPRLRLMAADKDARVIPSVIAALVELKTSDLEGDLLRWLDHPDVMVRAAAATAFGDLKIPAGEVALTKAYRDGAKDGAYSARAAALGALRQYGAAVAMPVLREALADKDWAIRVRAAALIRELDPAADVASAMRPGPARPETDDTDPAIVSPAVSPHVYFDTDKGTVEIELLVLDAPQTSANFLRLARDGYFTGVGIHRIVPNFVVQDGDPRGDGEGGPGYTIRDEINLQPYQRGTVGMALEWADTGGSQWFVTHSPQPHLDARYTVFGRVVSGMDVVDRLQQWDIIRRVRTWDGVTMTVK